MARHQRQRLQSLPLGRGRVAGVRRDDKRPIAVPDVKFTPATTFRRAVGIDMTEASPH